MPQTLSVIKAGIGGWVGHTAMHPEILAHAREAVARGVAQGLLIDAQAHACGDDVFLLLSHAHGTDNEVVHRFAWDTFVAGAEIARGLGLYGAGQDLIADAFPGNVRGTGLGCAELTLEERQSEPVVVFMADKTATGAFNLPLFQAFADPFNTSGLVLSEALHQGFAFEVHDVREQRRIMLTTPEEAYDLLALIGAPGRYAVRAVVSRATGEVAAVASTDRLSRLAGRYVGNDDPTAIVRCQGNFPSVGEVLEPFATARIVAGSMRGSHAAPWMPVSAAQATASRFDGPPRVVALGFQLHEGRLGVARDLFDDPAFDAARAEANRIADYLHRHGPFEPHRLPLDDMEFTTMPGAALKTASRWIDL
ncbi:MAG: fructose-1,6-bisphosphatase [Dehalococcoidia bacterium]